MIIQLFVTVHLYGLQVFEADGGKRELVLTIVESGHMLVSLGQELLVSGPGYYDLIVQFPLLPF